MSFKDVLKGHLSGFLGILTGPQAIAGWMTIGVHITIITESHTSA